MIKAPRHLGIIMDGNGRWAQQRGRPRTFGHIKGARTAKKIITAARELGVRSLTLYAFSTENWYRPEQEVSFLMTLLGRYLRKETANLVKENIQFTVIGDLDRLPTPLRIAAQSTIRATQHCDGMRLMFALSYGSRREIVETAKVLAQKYHTGELDLEGIDEAAFSQHLSTFPSPDVDLLIRTSGEKRISNFLLWQLAYSELAFTNTLWPDFTKQELLAIISDFNHRERRFGRVSETSNEQSAF